MITLSISSQPGLEQWSASLVLSEKQIRTAALRALNKTARWSRTQLARGVAQELEIKVGLVRKGLLLSRARGSRLESIVGLAPSAGVVNAGELGTPRQNERGVKVGRRQWDHAFLATMPNGHRGVFRRRDQSRLPIREINIVFTGRMAKAMEALSAGPALRQFDILFERELRFLTRV